MSKKASKEKNQRKWTPRIFVTRFKNLTLGFPPGQSWDKIKKTDEITMEIVSFKILQKKHPIKQKRDFDLFLFELLPDATRGRASGEDFLKVSEDVKGENLKTIYEKIRSSANKEMQSKIKSAKKQSEKLLYKFISENPWNLREDWVIKTFLDWQQRNFDARTKAERDAFKKKLEGIGKCLVVRTGEGRGTRHKIKHSFRFPKFFVDPRHREIPMVLHDLEYLMGELAKLESERERRKHLTAMLNSDHPREELYSSLCNYAGFTERIEEHTEDIILTLNDPKKGQIHELSLEIVSEIFGVSVGTIRKKFFEGDRAVEFEVKIFVNNIFSESWKT